MEESVLFQAPAMLQKTLKVEETPKERLNQVIGRNTRDIAAPEKPNAKVGLANLWGCVVEKLVP